MSRSGRVRAGQILIVLVLAGSVLWYLDAFMHRQGFFDLKVYYGAIRYWAGGHGQIYDFLRIGTKYGFTYPPFAMLAMLPMVVLPWLVVVTASWIMTGAVTLVLIYWLLAPAARRYGWPLWFVLTVAMVLAAGFEPLHETVSFGQVNMLLVVLVFADVILLLVPGAGPGAAEPGGPGAAEPGGPGAAGPGGPGAAAGGLGAQAAGVRAWPGARFRRWAGVGVGLATAIKLTPGIFILYLLLVRRFRAAAVAAATFAGATLLAMAVAPDASLEYWTQALWDTDRVGTLSYISNQSWQGLVARLDPARPSTALLAVLVLATLVVWAWRVRRALRAGDLLGGAVLTGVLGALVSPVTWVHHLVWLLPALLLLVDRALLAFAERRRRGIALLAFATVLYALLASEVVWHFGSHFQGWGLLGSNAYVYASVALLLGLPLAGRVTAAPGVESVLELEESERVAA